MKDYYQILGVDKTADAGAIKSAYRKLAKQHHPDANPGNKDAEAQFKEINEAYETLKDEGKRQNYDAQVQAASFQARTWQQGPFTFTQTFHHGGGADMNLDEILRDIRRSRTGAPMWDEAPRNRDINVTYSITLEEAFSGKESDMTYSLPGKPSKTVKFKIPAGIQEGTRLRFAGGGDDSIAGVAPGDLFIRILIMPHQQFVRHGPNHLATAIEIDYLDAILGKEVDVPTIDGKPIKLRVPAGIHPGQSLRAQGKGMPNGNGARGDMHIEVVINPTILTEEQRQLVEQARNLRNA
jgi:DnaJ-class molecular chaperone